MIERGVSPDFLFWRKPGAFDKIENSRRRIAELVASSTSRLEVLPLLFGMPCQIRFRVSLHERHVHRPPCDAEKRKPDELLLDEKLQKRDSAIHYDLKHYDIDPGLVIGDYEIPVLATQALDAANVQSIRVSHSKDDGIAVHPIFADCHDPPSQYSAECRNGNEQLENREQEYRDEPEYGIDRSSSERGYAPQIS